LTIIGPKGGEKNISLLISLIIYPLIKSETLRVSFNYRVKVKPTDRRNSEELIRLVDRDKLADHVMKILKKSFSEMSRDLWLDKSRVCRSPIQMTVRP